MSPHVSHEERAQACTPPGVRDQQMRLNIAWRSLCLLLTNVLLEIPECQHMGTSRCVYPNPQMSAHRAHCVYPNPAQLTHLERAMESSDFGDFILHHFAQICVIFEYLRRLQWFSWSQIALLRNRLLLQRERQMITLRWMVSLLRRFKREPCGQGKTIMKLQA